MSEQELEESFIHALRSVGYDRFNGRDQNALKENLRLQLERLNNVRFTDQEFDSLYLKIDSGSEYDRARFLYQEEPVELKCNPGVVTYIKFINKNWCSNVFQVGSQIRTSAEGHTNRFDVTLLVNGLPLVQIELKKPGVAIKNAVNQIKDYKQKGAYTHLFRYVQLFVVSNSVNTRYFANPGTEQVNSEFVFTWMDENNDVVNDLFVLAQDFFRPCFITRLIGDFMVIQPENKIMKVMRSYQVHAVKTLLAAVEAGVRSGNRYVWHPTGSGKTLTCFKTAKLVSQMRDGDGNLVVDKVLFLTDRKDLDSQGVRSFKEYDQDLTLDEVAHTQALIAHMVQPDRHLVATTIQKLHNVIKNNPESLASWRDKRVLILVDECHRTQFGAMHAQIVDFFRNVQMFGFTGTPIFAENATNGKTTEYIFGERAHEYNIAQAIRDKAVLPFSFQQETITVDQAGTPPTPHNSPPSSPPDLLQLPDIVKQFTWKTKVVNNIVKNHHVLTQNKKYSALFTVSSISDAVSYNDLFRQRRRDNETDVKVATIFSFNPSDEEVTQSGLDRQQLLTAVSGTINQFNHDFGTSYTTAEYETYKKEVASRLAAVDLDIVIVVDMLTTGYDAPRLNTVYVDKELNYHRLLQTFARSNRVSDASKTHGNIVAYRAGAREKMDEALALYGGGTTSSKVCIPPLSELLQDLREAMLHVKTIAPDIQDVDKLQSDVDIAMFLTAFSEALALQRRAVQYIGFATEVENSSYSEVTGVTVEDFDGYHSKYKDIRDTVAGNPNTPESSPLLEIDFEFVDGDRVVVNYDYIFNLTSNIITTHMPQDPAAYAVECEKLVALWAKDEQDLPTEHKSADLFAEFLILAPDLLRDTDPLTYTDTLRFQWSKFIHNKITRRLDNLATRVGLNTDIVTDYYLRFGKSFGLGIDQSITRDLKNELKNSTVVAEVPSVSDKRLERRKELAADLITEYADMHQTLDRLILEETK